MKKIAYVALIMSYQSGVAAKMQRLANTAIEEDISIDYHWFTTGYKQNEKVFKNINVRFSPYNNPFLTRIWQAKTLNKLCNNYDAVVIRYPLYDPFLDLILRHKKKIITEHHTKEIIELKLLGKKRYYIEQLFGNNWIKKFKGFIGVTEEIRLYETSRTKQKLNSIFIPNSIPVKNEIDLSEEKIGENKIIQIIFVANFRPWHGLNILKEGIIKYADLEDKYQLHLIGKIPDLIQDELKEFKNVKMYGELSNQDINEIYKKMDFAIGGFNLKVKKMKESTSLKVREYFLNGLPTLIGSKDPAFPDHFKYLIQKDEFDIPLIINYLEENKGVLKITIRNSADQYINSKYALKKLYNFATNE